MDAEIILEQLTEAYAQRDVLRLTEAEARKQAMPADVLAALADIEAEFSPKADAISTAIASLEEQAKAAVLAEGATVKGGALQAVYSKGRVSWDGKKLDGMMALVPGLSAARKEGEPSVSIRKVG